MRGTVRARCAELLRLWPSLWGDGGKDLDNGSSGVSGSSDRREKTQRKDTTEDMLLGCKWLGWEGVW